MSETNPSGFDLSRDWLGCWLTCLALLLVGIGLPLALWIGNADPDWAKIVFGHILFLAMVLLPIVLAWDAYRVALHETGIERALFRRGKVVKWDDIVEVQLGVGFRFVGRQGNSILVFPFVFKKKDEFYRLVEFKLPWFRVAAPTDYGIPHIRRRPV
jgi:hypothetical protein